MSTCSWNDDDDDDDDDSSGWDMKDYAILAGCVAAVLIGLGLVIHFSGRSKMRSLPETGSIQGAAYSALGDEGSDGAVLK